MRRRQFIGLVGGMAAAPVLQPWAVRAQQAGKPYRIAYLALLSGENTSYAKPLLQRLEELGYREGRNMIWDYRSAEGRAERLPQLAAELVRAGPDVLITGFGTLAPKAAVAANPQHTDRFHVGRRPRWRRPGREPEPAGRKRHRHERAVERHCRQEVAVA